MQNFLILKHYLDITHLVGQSEPSHKRIGQKTSSLKRFFVPHKPSRKKKRHLSRYRICAILGQFFLPSRNNLRYFYHLPSSVKPGEWASALATLLSLNPVLRSIAKPKFRVTCSIEGRPPVHAKHEDYAFRSRDVEACMAKAIQILFPDWSVGLKVFDIEIYVVVKWEKVKIGITIFSTSDSGLFPLLKQYSPAGQARSGLRVHWPSRLQRHLNQECLNMEIPRAFLHRNSAGLETPADSKSDCKSANAASRSEPSPDEPVLCLGSGFSQPCALFSSLPPASPQRASELSIFPLAVVKALFQRFIYSPWFRTSCIHQRDRTGHTALMLACLSPDWNGASKCAKRVLSLCLTLGTRPSQVDWHGWDAVFWCCFSGNRRGLRLLLTRGGPALSPDPTRFGTLLSICVRLDRLYCLHLLCNFDRVVGLPKYQIFLAVLRSALLQPSCNMFAIGLLADHCFSLSLNQKQKAALEHILRKAGVDIASANASDSQSRALSRSSRKQSSCYSRRKRQVLMALREVLQPPPIVAASLPSPPPRPQKNRELKEKVKDKRPLEKQTSENKGNRVFAFPSAPRFAVPCAASAIALSLRPPPSAVSPTSPQRIVHPYVASVIIDIILHYLCP